MNAPRAGLRSRVCLVLATTALTPPLASWAQTSPGARPAQPAPPGVSAPELNPAARLPRPQPRSSQDIFEPEPPGPCPLADSDLRVTLSSVAFRGATAVTPADLRGAYAEFLGKPAPVAVLCTIRDRAARILFDRGVLARVEIPEQRMAGGALTLEVIEAHVVNVRVRGDIGPAQAAVERYIEKLRGMSPFDMRRAQRYLLLASDIPGVRTRAAIRPSASGERGAVDVDVTVTRDAYQALANVQNLGSTTVGRWGGLVRGEADSLTAYGESTSLVAFHTLDSNEQWLVQAAETGRFGGEGLAGRASLIYGQSHPGASLKPLGLKSQSFVGNLEATYPLVRLRATNLNLAGGFDWIDQKTTIGGAGLLNRDKLRVLYARADGDYRTEAAGRPLLFTGGVTLRKGIAGLGASSPDSLVITRAFGKPDAWLVRGAGSAEAVITDRLTASVRAQAQYTSDPLLPYEQLALGNLTVGRGYDPAALLGDSGISGAFDLRYGPVQLHPQLQAAPYVFYDAGWVRNNDAALSGLQRSRTLRSFGAGVVFRIARRANLDLAYARPERAVTGGGKRPESRLLVQLTASLK